MPIPHTTTFDWSTLHPRSGRLAASIQSEGPEGCRIALLGLPDDTGIMMNDGRRGARQGPAAFRQALALYGSAHDATTGCDLSALGIFDAGDVEPAGDEIHHTHERVTDAVAALLDLGLLPVCIGGGHDMTYPAVRALCNHLAERNQRFGGINIDPHLDVREQVGSGMAFRRIIEESGEVIHTRCFAEVGLGPFANSTDHIAWLVERGCRLVFFDGNQHELFDRFTEVLEVLGKAPNFFASFDLDVMDASVAPGVSAVNPMGLTSVTASLMCRALGRMPNLRYFDIMELSPPHDVESSTARLAVHLFLSFLGGVASRVLG